MQSMENFLTFYSSNFKYFNSIFCCSFATSSTGKSFNLAISSATSVTQAGSFRFPRYGWGANKVHLFQSINDPTEFQLQLLLAFLHF